MAELSFPEVNAAGLFLLSRKLMQIAEAALPQQKGATSMRLILLDIVYHPDSSITEITTRTGFPQSLVSMTVAKLRDIGVLETSPDSADRRRTLVRPTPRLIELGEQGPGGVPIEEALADAIDVDAQQQIPDALAALDLLARLLVPEVTDTAEPGTTPVSSERT